PSPPGPKQFAQPLPRVVQIRARSATRYTQHLSNLGVRKALDVMQDYYRPRPFREPCHCGLEPLPQLPAFRRVPECRWHRIRELLRISDLPSPRQIERRIGNDPVQPGAEGLGRIEPVQRLVRAQKSVLDRVLGVLVRENDRPRHNVGASLVQTHEAGETPLVSLLGQTYELSLLVRYTRLSGRALRVDQRVSDRFWV